MHGWWVVLRGWLMVMRKWVVLVLWALMLHGDSSLPDQGWVQVPCGQEMLHVLLGRRAEH